MRESWCACTGGGTTDFTDFHGFKKLILRDGQDEQDNEKTVDERGGGLGRAAPTAVGVKYSSITLRVDYFSWRVFGG